MPDHLIHPKKDKKTPASTGGSAGRTYGSLNDREQPRRRPSPQGPPNFNQTWIAPKKDAYQARNCVSQQYMYCAPQVIGPVAFIPSVGRPDDPWYVRLSNLIGGAILIGYAGTAIGGAGGKSAAGTSAAEAAAAGAAKSDAGLSTRGLTAARETRVKPAGIPDGWRITGTKSPGGVLYRDPNNAGNSVRVMQGNPNSPFPNSQGPYVRWQKNGQPLDRFGNQLPSAKLPEAHIPLNDFKFLPEVFG